MTTHPDYREEWNRTAPVRLAHNVTVRKEDIETAQPRMVDVIRYHQEKTMKEQYLQVPDDGLLED